MSIFNSFFTKCFKCAKSKVLNLCGKSGTMYGVDWVRPSKDGDEPDNRHVTGRCKAISRGVWLRKGVEIA